MPSSPSRRRPSALRRRLVTIPAVGVAFAVLSVGAPVLLPLALVFDLARLGLRGTPLTASRLYLFGLAYTLAELVGLAMLAATWPIAPAGSERSLGSDRSPYEPYPGW